MVVLRGMIALQNIDKSFNGEHILQNVSLEIPDNQICGVFGKSGIGKSTLAKILCGVCPPDAGRILLDNRCLVSNDRPYDRRLGISIQMVYQQPYATLDPRQKIGSGFRELIRYHRFAPKGKEQALTEEILTKVGLEPQILAHLPHQISGGEAQRVAIARCLLFQPRLLILDEATSMLDVSTQANVLGVEQMIWNIALRFMGFFGILTVPKKRLSKTSSLPGMASGPALPILLHGMIIGITHDERCLWGCNW